MSRPTSFESLFRTYLRRVLRLAQLYGLHEREAESVAQEVFLVVHRAAQRGWVEPSALSWPWLRTTTYRIARDCKEALEHQGPPATRKPMDHSLFDIARRVAVRQQWDLIFELLDGIDFERRAVFVLHELEELTMDEIADELELPSGAIQSRLRMARVEFEEALRERRATEQRTTNGVGAILLPLGPTSLLRIARTLPSPELRPGAQAEVWARIQRVIGESAPVPVPPRRAGRLATSHGGLALTMAIAFGAGVIAGAAGAALLEAVRPSLRQAAPAPSAIVAIAVREKGYLPATLPPAPSAGATASDASGGNGHENFGR